MMTVERLLARTVTGEPCLQVDLLQGSIAFVRQAAQSQFTTLVVEVLIEQLYLPQQPTGQMQYLVHLEDQVTSTFTIQEPAYLLRQLTDRGGGKRFTTWRISPVCKKLTSNSTASCETCV